MKAADKTHEGDEYELIASIPLSKRYALFVQMHRTPDGLEKVDMRRFLLPTEEGGEPRPTLAGIRIGPKAALALASALTKIKDRLGGDDDEPSPKTKA